MVNVRDIIFAMLRIAIGTYNGDLSIFMNLSKKDWSNIFNQSVRQGILGLTCVAIDKLPDACKPPMQIKLAWYISMEKREKSYDKKLKISSDFAEYLHKNNINCLVLKGLSYSTYYPVPSHREFGDLDCYLFGEFEKGNQLARQIGAKVDKGWYKHSNIIYQGLPIENHRFFIGFGGSKSCVRLEKSLSRILEVENNFESINDTFLLKPSANFEALFLIKHAQQHFISDGIRLRYILDWAVFLQHCYGKIDWEMINAEMKSSGMLEFASIFNSICRDYLGISVSDKQNFNNDAKLIRAVLDDTFGEQPPIADKNLFYKVKRVLRRFVRMWRFKKLLDENYFLKIWNSFAYSSYVKRNPTL